jgi:hypothetical protein
LLEGIRRHLTYANVMASIAVFIALGAGAYAAGLTPDSVKSKHIADGQVKARDLGLPAQYTSAGLPHYSASCDAPGNAWFTWDYFNAEVGYYRDPFGIVHLQGVGIKCGNPIDRLFTLPSGYRPEGSVYTSGVKNGTDFHQVRIHSSGEVEATTPGFASGNSLSLEGITFRCGPSGVDGCP